MNARGEAKRKTSEQTNVGCALIGDFPVYFIQKNKEVSILLHFYLNICINTRANN